MTIFQLLLSAAGIVLAARWLARSAERLAHSTGLGQAFVGAIFLAASTSAPEFFVDIRASMDGLPDLAAGDLLGSSIINLSILAVAFLSSEKSRWQDTAAPATVPLSFLAVLLTGEAACLIYWYPDGDFAGIHWGSYLIVVTYFAGSRLVFRSEAQSNGLTIKTQVHGTRAVLSQATKFAGATLVIFFLSPLLVASMEKIALATGIDRTFIGTTLLALTTSLPELVSTMTAIRLGAPTLAVGNIVGSNAFNMTIFFFMDWAWGPPNLWSSLSHHHVLSALLVVGGMSALGIISSVRFGKKEMTARIVLGLILLVNFIGMLILFESTQGASPQ